MYKNSAIAQVGTENNPNLHTLDYENGKVFEARSGVCRTMIPIWIYALYDALSTYSPVSDLHTDTSSSRWLQKLDTFVLYP